MIAVVSRTVEDISAGHFLPGYKGDCANQHGHNWTVEVGVSGPILDGFVIDFKELDGFLANVKSEFDHKNINSIIPMPTAENIGLRIAKKFELWSWSRKIDLAFVRVWETRKSMFELRA